MIMKGHGPFSRSLKKCHPRKEPGFRIAADLSKPLARRSHDGQSTTRFSAASIRSKKWPGAGHDSSLRPRPRHAWSFRIGQYAGERSTIRSGRRFRFARAVTGRFADRAAGPDSDSHASAPARRVQSRDWRSTSSINATGSIAAPTGAQADDRRSPKPRLQHARCGESPHTSRPNGGSQSTASDG